MVPHPFQVRVTKQGLKVLEGDGISATLSVLLTWNGVEVEVAGQQAGADPHPDSLDDDDDDDDDDVQIINERVYIEFDEDEEEEEEEDDDDDEDEEGPPLKAIRAPRVPPLKAQQRQHQTPPLSLAT